MANRYEKEFAKNGNPVLSNEERLKNLGGSQEKCNEEKRNPEKRFQGLGNFAKNFFRKIQGR